MVNVKVTQKILDSLKEAVSIKAEAGVAESVKDKLEQMLLQAANGNPSPSVSVMNSDVAAYFRKNGYTVQELDCKATAFLIRA